VPSRPPAAIGAMSSNAAEAREEAAIAEERQRVELELAMAQFNTTRQQLRNELRILNEEAEAAQQQARDEAEATRQQARDDAEAIRQAGEEAEAVRRRAVEEMEAQHDVERRQAEEVTVEVEKARAAEAEARAEAAMQDAAKIQQVLEATEAERARAEAERARAEDERARAEDERARAEADAEATRARAHEDVEAVRTHALSELRRRTGALAEQQAQAMKDEKEKHAEELKEVHRQVRLAESPSEGGVGAISSRLRFGRDGAAGSSIKMDETVQRC